MAPALTQTAPEATATSRVRWKPTAPEFMPLRWCPVCGSAPATVTHDGFCSRACRTVSVDYHNRQSILADQEYERSGPYVHDKTFDVKGTRPGRGGRRRTAPERRKPSQRDLGNIVHPF